MENKTKEILEQSKKRILIKMYDKLDNYPNLNLFQKAFVKEIYYWTNKTGKFDFIKSHYIKKYSEVISEADMLIDIYDLEKYEYIIKNIKKTIHNGKYISLISYQINKDFLEYLKR